jgi:single-strand DNA-binding protein
LRNLTRDPELRYTPSGQANAVFGVAVERRYSKDGAWVSQTSFFDVKCWGDLAENVAESLCKGNRSMVVGRLEQETWQDKETQAKRSKVGRRGGLGRP